MPRLERGALRLFRLFGVDISLHWSWLLVLGYFLVTHKGALFGSLAFNLALFTIVLLHELGHVLACRSVGGKAERIVLSPLGGVAHVSPPARPGAVLWSIAAGPLVNLLLLPLCAGAAVLAPTPDAQNLFTLLAWADLLLLVFNLLPIYPLDGGQILHALLWIFVGRVRALRWAATLGLAGTLVGVAAALWFRQPVITVLAILGALRAFAGLRQANAAGRLEAAPRRATLQCPLCGTSPPVGDFWTCPCDFRFDPFANSGVCPRCHSNHSHTACVACGRPSLLDNWPTA